MSNTQSSQNLSSLPGYLDKGWNQRIGFNEELLFYVDHGVVYDANGGIIGSIFHPTTQPQGTDLLTGYPEILIVPVPGSCFRYYIISAYMLAPGGPAGTNPVPGYATLDLETGGLINADPNGNVVTTSVSNGQTGIWTNFNVHCSEMHLACSEPLPNGNRWLFISNCGSLYRAEITSTGISQAVSISSFPQAQGGSNWGSSTAKSELEVWETPAGISPKSYRIAAPLGGGNNHIGLVQLDNNGNVVGTPILITPTIPPGGASHNLKGMEFSPDGNYLYITSDVGDGLRCYDVSNGATISLPQITNFPAEFNYSMIERGKDQALYVVSTERNLSGTLHSVLGRIQNPNSPSTATFDPNWNIFPSRHIDTSFPPGNFQTSSGGTGGTPQFTNLNVLPDQMDGEDYLATIPIATLPCCEFTTDYADEGSEPLQTSIEQDATWEPGNNPVGGASAIWIKGILEIQPGVNFTLRRMNLNFGPQGKVIVHPGAILRIESSVLSGNPRCSTMWQGVEVWGDVNQGAAGEGKLFMSQLPNNTRSRIEQALNGIATRDGQSIALIKDGGFIRVEDSDFSNNLTDIYYVSDPLSGAPSEIKNCNFTSQTGALWHPFTGATTSTHLWCKEVDASDIILTGLNNYFLNGKVGIFLNETHNLQTDDLLFEKCDVGIWSMQTGATGLPSQHEINRNRFRGVHTAIRIENGMEDEISNNIFNSLYTGIPAGTDQSQDKNFYGVFLNACGHYRISDNIFNHNKYGIYIRNTGEYNGWVDAFQNGNFFNECWRGIHTDGENQLVQIRCNTFNNVNQPASQFSTAWFVNGDLPNQGGPGSNPEDAAGNYFNKPFPRTDLNGILGNTATSCDPTKNFCYYYNQSPANVNPAIGTPNTIRKDANNAFQTSCRSRDGLMELAENDPGLARELIDNEQNPVLKTQYLTELTQWYRSQNQIDSVLSLLNAIGDKQQLYNNYVNLDSLSLASDILLDMEASGINEDVTFSQVNRLLLELKENGKALQQLDSTAINFLRSVVDMNFQVSEQARGILYLVDSVYTPIPIEGDTGVFRLSQSLIQDNNKPTIRIIGNPVKDVLLFDLSESDSSSQIVTIELIDAFGKIVHVFNESKRNQHSIPVQNLNQGFYILRVRGDDLVLQTNFIKQ